MSTRIALSIIAMGGLSMASAETLTFDCGPLQLGFDSENGQWIALAAADGENLLSDAAPDITIEADGLPSPDVWRASPPTAQRDGDDWLVSVPREAENWQAAMRYRVTPEGWLGRSLTLTWTGDNPQKLWGVALRAPGIALADDAVWCLPGNYAFAEHRIADALEGRSTREQGWTWSDTGAAHAYSEARQLGIVGSYTCTLDHAWARVDEADGSVALTHRFDTMGILQPRDSVEIGVQWFGVVSGDREALRESAGAIADLANAGPPADRPAWLDGAVIEELHPWGRLEAWHGGDRGSRMPDIEAQLPYLRDLGVDGIWLLPVTNKPPWVYFLPEFRTVDETVTTEEQLRSFIATGHELGMRTLMDLVTYGINPKSPDIAKLPEHVWSRDEAGEIQLAWSDTVQCADLTEPDWNDHIVDLTSWWVGDFGADGFRLDCGGGGQKPNWKPRTGARANATMQAGGIRQNALIRAAIRDANPDAVLMPEAGQTGFFQSCDMLFDYPLYMVCREITNEPDTGRWVRQAREWLAAQQMTHSPGQQASLVRFLENHDTVAAQDFWGVGPSQAMTALCAFIPGVLLLHQEQEIGFAPELRKWLRVRHDLEELRSGTADYRGVTASDPNVLAFTRSSSDSRSVVAINFGATDVRCKLDLSALGTVPSTGVDATNLRLVALDRPVAISAYRPVVIMLRDDIQPPQRGPARPGRDAEPLVSGREVVDLDGGTKRHVIRFAPVSEWFVRTDEGMLRDGFIDRHRKHRDTETHVDATIPLWRCWRPLEQGYWDGDGPAILGMVSADGRATEVRITDESTVKRARIVDDSSIGEQAEIWIETGSDAEPFTVTEHPFGAPILARFVARAAEAPSLVDVDALWVKARNDHYELALSRRHGGTIYDLRPSGGERSLIARSSEVYTDWGLYEKSLHVATEWEATPRLSVRERDGATEITFTGHLRRPAWNGVHAGHIIEPNTVYRLTFTVDDSPTIGVTVGITPSVERADAEAFVAYRIPFAGVTSWSAAGQTGNVGDQRGERVFQAGQLDSLDDLTMSLQHADGTLTVSSITGDPAPPQNPFLLDAGDAFHLFFAMLNGQTVTLPAGEERAYSFDLTVETP